MRKLICLAALLTLGTGLANAQEDASAGNPKVTLNTSKGAITLELYREQAPVSVDNFLRYARDGFFDGTIFHRVISHFMIQGGGFTADGQRKPTREPIRNEADNGLKNLRGTIAMARTTDPHSATAQFFINVELNPNLDHKGQANSSEWGYAVFGHVTEGMEVVDDIRFVPTDNRDWPLEAVVIESVTVE